MAKRAAHGNGNGNNGGSLELRRSHWVALSGVILSVFLGGGVLSWWSFARNVVTSDQAVNPKVYEAEQRGLQRELARTAEEVGKVTEGLHDVKTKLAVQEGSLDDIKRQLSVLIQGQAGAKRP